MNEIKTMKNEIEAMKSKIANDIIEAITDHHNVKRSADNMAAEPFKEGTDVDFWSKLHAPKFLMIVIFIIAGIVIVMTVMAYKLTQITKLLKSKNQSLFNEFRKEPQCKISISKINSEYHPEQLIENGNGTRENSVRRRKSTIMNNKPPLIKVLDGEGRERVTSTPVSLPLI